MEEARRRLGGQLEDNWRTERGLEDNFSIRALKLAANHKKKFLRFLHFYPLISSFQALSCDQDDTAHFPLSIGIKKS